MWHGNHFDIQCLLVNVKIVTYKTFEHAGSKVKYNTSQES